MIDFIYTGFAYASFKTRNPKLVAPYSSVFIRQHLSSFLILVRYK